jgi:hypothetical protein
VTTKLGGEYRGGAVIRYKLTDGEGKTRGGTEWGPGITHTTNGKGDLCGFGWLHCYSDPVLAVLLNPIHARFENPRLCEVEVSGKTLGEYGLKEGWTQMAFVRWLDLPEVTAEQRVRFAILCAREVCHLSYQPWLEWADKWLSGADRSLASAKAACNYLNLHAFVFTNAASYAICQATKAAVTEAALMLKGRFQHLVDKTAHYATANVAINATRAAGKLDLIGLAHQAVEQP